MSKIILYEKEIAAIENERKAGVLRTAAEQYWADKENGISHDQLISMFKAGHEGDARTAIHMLVELSIYCLENERDIFGRKIDISDRRLFKYADMYEYLAREILCKEYYLRYMIYAFGGAYPPFVVFCHNVFDEFAREKCCMDYDSLEETPAKRNMDRIYRYLSNLEESALVSIISNNDETGVYYCYKVSMEKKMNPEYRNDIQVALKNGLLKVHSLGGHIIVVRTVNNMDISYTGFKVENGRITVAGKDEISEVSNSIIKTSDLFDDRESAYYDFATESGNYYEPYVNLEEA